MEAINVDQLSHSVLSSVNDDVAQQMGGDVVLMNASMFPPLDDEFRISIENVRETSKENHLIVILETNGGLMETVERLVAVMRAHYDQVSFVIPNYAYSAGTVLALSGDKIYMDYYSVLGPIDPQYLGSDGTYLPGHGVLSKYKQLTDQINASKNSDDVRAELAFLIKNFDPAQLFQLEQAVEHGITLITEWLPKYKFKNWDKTTTKRTKVTPSMKIKRAKEIARTLGDASKWHSHGRGIPMKRLQGDELKLAVDDFGANKNLSTAIRNYHGLAADYFAKSNMHGYVHTSRGVRRIL